MQFVINLTINMKHVPPKRREQIVLSLGANNSKTGQASTPINNNNNNNSNNNSVLLM
jgi:hypothetical protein